MQLATFLSQYLGKTPSEIFDAPTGRIVDPHLDLDGKWSFPGWDPKVLGKPAPSSDEVAAALAAPPMVGELSDVVVSRASAICDAITAQVVPDETHRLAYGNAATIVWGSGGKAPSAEPAKSAFDALATSVGMQSDAFASVAQAVSLSSLQLAAALSTLRASVASDETLADLKSSVSAFESKASDLVSSLNSSGLTVTISAPLPLSIPGLP